MRLKRLLISLILPMFIFCTSAMAQDKVITGRVTDSKDGAGLPGVTVSAKGAQAVTAADGSFKITVPATVTTLTATSVGYLSQDIAITGTSVSVALIQNASSLGEVVVVAYGTRKKEELTTAVASVSAKDFQKGINPSPEQLLQGKVAGLQVTSGGGSAGGGSKIRIRGEASLNASNDPLIVIDGIPVDNNKVTDNSPNVLSTINPNDIESMSVLKDAAATVLYGSRASNGVIIITTKKGARGKIKFNYNNLFSVASVAKKVDVFTGDEIRKIVTDDAAASGNNQWANLLGTANTDWQDVIFQKAGSIDNNISAAGSAGPVPFRASLGYLDQDGILKTNNYKRFTSALNISPKLFKNHLSVNINVKTANAKDRRADEDAIGNAISIDPTKPVFDTASKYGGYWEWLNAQGGPNTLAPRNPLGLLELRNKTVTTNRLIGNVQLDYKLHFFPDMHVLVNLGMDKTNVKGDDLIDSTSAKDARFGNTAGNGAGTIAHFEGSKTNYLADVFITYNKEIKNINSKIDVLLGHSYQDFAENVKSFPVFSQRGTHDTIAGTIPLFPTDKIQNRLESYIGRINLDIAGKYMLSGSLRRDASSRFSRENRVGYYPGFSAAWRLKQEFFKNVNIINDLKLRYGWGKTGQQDGIGFYSYLPYFGYNTNPASQYQFGDVFYGTLTPLAYDLVRQWEQTTSNNIGLDFSLFSNRISGSIDFYHKKTNMLLSKIDIGPGTNYDIRLEKNVGNLENKGVEFVFNTTPVRTRNFTWDFGFNITWQETKLTNLTEYDNPNFKGIPVSGITGGTGNNIGRYAVGYAPFTYFMYKQVYDAQTGLPVEGVFEDINRDGIINDDDRTYSYKPAPDYLLGFSTQFTYKKWSLSVTGHGTTGNYLYNNFFSNGGTLRNITNPVIIVGNASRSYEESGFVNNQFISDYYLENASYFRFDNINVGYTAGKVFGNNVGLRVFASMQNVATITKYKGLDPESSSREGTDYKTYPRPRIISIGFGLDF